MIRIAILDDYAGLSLGCADWSTLGTECEVTVFNEHLGFDDDVVVAALNPFDVLVCMRERTPLTKARIDRLENLKLIVTTGMRNLAFDMVAARDRGIPVCGTRNPDYHACEHAWALTMALVKQIPSEDRAMKAGKWQTTLGRGFSGKVFGLLGLGKVGARAAKVALALDMKVIAWSANLTDERAAEVGAQRVEKEDLFRQADVLQIHTLLSDRTRGLVGAQELALMKPTSYLINTSRGPIVETDALVNALQNKALTGAAVDVYDHEPLPRDHVLRSLDNLVLTGHTAPVIREFYETGYQQSLECVVAWLKGTPLRVLNEAR